MLCKYSRTVHSPLPHMLPYAWRLPFVSILNPSRGFLTDIKFNIKFCLLGPWLLHYKQWSRDLDSPNLILCSKNRNFLSSCVAFCEQTNGFSILGDFEDMSWVTITSKRFEIRQQLSALACCRKRQKGLFRDLERNVTSKLSNISLLWWATV